MFTLHPRLQQDCLNLGRWTLCRVLLMNESRYPWLVLVPEREGVSEIFQLSPADQAQAWREASALARLTAAAFAADKMNIAAIGNLVPQLHIHVIARRRDDAAWPAPVWGRFDPLPYEPAALAEVVERLRACLPADFHWQPA